MKIQLSNDEVKRAIALYLENLFDIDTDNFDTTIEYDKYSCVISLDEPKDDHYIYTKSSE